jgi:hypothetical protein
MICSPASGWRARAGLSITHGIMPKRILLDNNVPRHNADTIVKINCRLGTAVPGAN